MKAAGYSYYTSLYILTAGINIWIKDLIPNGLDLRQR